MRALTVRQPWAALIVAGTKRIENRGWRLPSAMVMQRIAIHAGLSVDAEAIRAVEIEHLIPRSPSWDVTGAIVGFATLCGCVDSADGAYNFFMRAGEPIAAVRQREWFSGPFGFILADAEQFREPVPCRGNLGLWHVPGEVMSKFEIGLVA